MKLAKYLNVMLLTVFAACCFSANSAFAYDQLALITFNSTGKEVKAEELMYYPLQKIWGFYVEGSDQEQKVKAGDVTVNTPAGMLFPGKDGALVINAGDECSITEIKHTNEQWLISVEDLNLYNGPIARVTPHKSKKAFDVEFHMYFDMASNMWTFHCETGQQQRTYSADDVDVEIGAGKILMFEGNLWIYWGDDDWRKDQLPMQILVDPDGNWDIRHGMIGQ